MKIGQLGSFILCCFFCYLCCQPVQLLQAQPKVASPLVLSNTCPSLALPFPYGVQRGTTTDLILTGNHLQSPQQMWTSFPCKVQIPTDQNNGKEPGKLKVQLQIPADAPLGLGYIRLVTAQGVSPARLLVIDDVPTFLETEQNRTKDKAVQVTIPCAVAGRIDNESSDFYRFAGKAGQKVSIEVYARRIGTSLDPAIYLYDATTGRDLPGGYADDTPGLQGDNRFTYTFPKDGDYLLEVRDSTYRGGADFGYRVKIGDFPFATTAWPIHLKQGSKTEIGFTGNQLHQTASLPVQATKDKSHAALTPIRSNGHAGWPVDLMFSDNDSILEVEPNNDPAKAMRLTVPVHVSARFLDKGDLDYFVFSAKKGKKVTIVAETTTIHSPAEVYLTIKEAKTAADPKSPEIAKSNPQNPTALIEFNPPNDGDYVLKAEHLLYAHGPEEVYSLTLREEGSFDVQLGLDRQEITPGGTALFPVMSVNRRDYTGPIELKVIGNPNVSGTVTIPANVTQAAANQVLALLPVQLNPKATGLQTFEVIATAKIQDRQIIRPVSVSEILRPNFSGLPFLPARLAQELALIPMTKPFQLKTKLSAMNIVQGATVQMTIQAERVSGNTDPIDLQVLLVPANVTIPIKPLAKDQKEITIPITAAANAAIGESKILLRGIQKEAGKEVIVFSDAIPLVITASKKDKK